VNGHLSALPAGQHTDKVSGTAHTQGQANPGRSAANLSSRQSISICASATAAHIAATPSHNVYSLGPKQLSRNESGGMNPVEQQALAALRSTMGVPIVGSLTLPAAFASSSLYLAAQTTGTRSLYNVQFQLTTVPLAVNNPAINVPDGGGLADYLGGFGGGQSIRLLKPLCMLCPRVQTLPDSPVPG
jgi:hypothetical protein